MNPPDLRYSEEHEWVRSRPGRVAEIGITDFAAECLGDVVFVELPSVGEELTQFGKMGEIESVKTVSDLFMPLSGKVLEVNTSATDSPEVVNEAPYHGGWLLRVLMTNESELDNLMSADQYEAFLASQE